MKIIRFVFLFCINLSVCYAAYSQQNKHVSLGTKQGGIALGMPTLYYGIVLSPISPRATQNSTLYGMVLSSKIHANMLAGFGLSFVDMSAQLYGVSSSLVCNANNIYGVATSLYHTATRSNGVAIGLGFMRGIHRGLSASLINYSETKGFKIAGFVGNNHVKGVQIGGVLMGESRGVRIALCNAKFSHSGVCMGLINSSTVLRSSSGYYGGTFGLSLGFINAGYNSGGYQIGIINSIRESIRPRIIQLGAVNFAKVAEKSLQIGIINSNGVGVNCKQIGILNIQRSNRWLFKIVPFYNVTRVD